MEKPLYFDPFGQIAFAPVGHNIIALCKVLVQGSIILWPKWAILFAQRGQSRVAFPKNTENIQKNIKNMKNFGLNQKIEGKAMMQFMADLIESNEKQEIEIERGKLTVSILKQMHNNSRLQIGSAKFALKQAEAETCKEMEV